MADGPYRTAGWSLVRVRSGGLPGAWLFGLMGGVLFVVSAAFIWMLVVGVPEGVSASPLCGVLFLVPFTILWISGLVENARAKVSYFREGIVCQSGRVAWDDVIAVSRARQDPEVTTPPAWVIVARDGRTLQLPGWLVEKSDLAPLAERGFMLPDEAQPPA